VFIQIIQGKCTRQDELHAKADKWQEEIGPLAEGWLGGTYGFTDDDMFVAVVRFDSKESAMANSARPEQGQWWAQMEPLFDGPVEFHDCNDVSLMLDGGSDSAGFVQIIRGKVEDPDRLKSMLQQGTEMMHAARPDVLGMTLAIEDDGTFTQTVAFTDEASARAGESKEMPEEAAQEMHEWDEVMKDVSYMDLRHPWFTSHA
jgi:hypothetical protein